MEVALDGRRAAHGPHAPRRALRHRPRHPTPARGRGGAGAGRRRSRRLGRVRGRARAHLLARVHRRRAARARAPPRPPPAGRALAARGAGPPHGQGGAGVRGARRRAAGRGPLDGLVPRRHPPGRAHRHRPRAWPPPSTTWSTPCCAGTARATGRSRSRSSPAGTSSRCGRSAPSVGDEVGAAGRRQRQLPQRLGRAPRHPGPAGRRQPSGWWPSSSRSPPDDLVGHARLARRIDVPVCLDESIGSLAQLDIGADARGLRGREPQGRPGGRAGRGPPHPPALPRRGRVAALRRHAGDRPGPGAQPGGGRAARVQPAARPRAVGPLLPHRPHAPVRVPGWHHDRAQRARPRRRARCPTCSRT